MIDREVSRQPVQSLDSRDAVASFVAYLGYNVDQRTEQRPENLGIKTDSLKRDNPEARLVESMRWTLPSGQFAW